MRALQFKSDTYSAFSRPYRDWILAHSEVTEDKTQLTAFLLLAHDLQSIIKDSHAQDKTGRDRVDVKKLLKEVSLSRLSCVVLCCSPAFSSSSDFLPPSWSLLLPLLVCSLMHSPAVLFLHLSIRIRAFHLLSVDPGDHQRKTLLL